MQSLFSTFCVRADAPEGASQGWRASIEGTGTSLQLTARAHAKSREWLSDCGVPFFFGYFLCGQAKRK